MLGNLKDKGRYGLAKKTNNSGGVAGFNFQDMAALYLFLDNVDEVQSFEVEGKEDVVLTWNDGTNSFIQAKETQNPYDTFNKKYVIDALRVLSQDVVDYGLENIKSEVLLTNSNYLFGKRAGQEFANAPHRKYSSSSLPPRMLKKLEEFNRTLDHSEIDFAKLKVMKIEYSGDDDETKLSELEKKVRKFMDTAHINLSKYDSLLKSMLFLVYRSAEDSKKSISKKDFASYTAATLLIGTSQIERFLTLFNIDFENEDYIRSQYSEFLSPKAFDFSVTSKVNMLLFDYGKQNHGLSRDDKARDFVNKNYEKICAPLGIDIENDVRNKDVAKFILWLIVTNNSDFSNIKEALNYED